MTYAEALALMKALADRNNDWQDPEVAHIEADKLLCDFLRASDHGLLVDQYERIGKWYA
jgi:hypothetical protein